jgi:hypothetical protein
MSCQSRISPRIIAPALLFGTLLAGCSDIYFDRREGIVPVAGNAIAANRAAQMVDPWPPESANKNIAFNGQKMQSAVERYRQNRVIPPASSTTSSVAYQQQQAQTAGSTASSSTTTVSPKSP